MRFLLALLPAAACAAAMFLCLRMMRHSDMPDDADDLDSLRKEVADLREELARSRSALSESAGEGVRKTLIRGPSDAASDTRPLDVRTHMGATRTIGRPR